MSAVHGLQAAQIDKMFDADKGLSLKDSVVLNKYIIAAMEMLAKKDAKTGGLVNYPTLLKL